MTETRSDEVQNDHKQPSGEGGMKEAAELGQVVEISSSDADEARVFLENHPRGAEVRQEGQAILEDPEQHKNLVRKIDMVVMPLICLTYFLQYLDKTTLNYAAVMGIRTDAHLVGQDYANLTMWFYVAYLACEFPTQLLAQRASRLGLYLGANVALWGAVLACHAAAGSYAQLAALRALLGAFESCVAPILVLVVAMWYRKEERGRRVSWFYACNCLGSIFGGLVAYGVSFGATRFATWRIFFLAIGLFTIAAGVAVVVLLPDSPVKAKRFSDGEKMAILLRLQEDQSGTQNAVLKWEQVLETFKDLRVWIVVVCTLLACINNGGLTTFSSILLTTFDYTSQQALIFAVPSGAIGVVTILASGYLSDRWNNRSSIMWLCLTPTILGAALMMAYDLHGAPSNKTALLAGYFLATGPISASFMLLLAWNASNIAGHSKKVAANALTMVAFCAGSITGTQTFQAREAPGYLSGKITIVATLGSLFLLVLVLRFYNDWLNGKKREALAGMSEAERQELRQRTAFADLTDRKNVFFVYTK